MLEAGTDVVAIVAKCSAFQVEKALRINKGDNLAMIWKTVKYLKGQGKTVFVDMEHYFDGLLDPEHGDARFVENCLRAAIKGGVDRIVLCDTNGGSSPKQIAKGVKFAKKIVGKIPLGIHCHKDRNLATSNSITAVEEGVDLVQGTVNGFGERAGNDDLIVLLPNLYLVERHRGIDLDKIQGLRRVSRAVYELVNISPRKNQPFVGDTAFKDKGGSHISAQARDKRCHAFIAPEAVGNRRDSVISDRAGRSLIQEKLKVFGTSVRKDHPTVETVYQWMIAAEKGGINFDAAPASFDLMVASAITGYKEPFEIDKYTIFDASGIEPTATVGVNFGHHQERKVGDGLGPVDALNIALRDALLSPDSPYESLKGVELKDYKVRTIGNNGTRAVVRVLCEFSNGKDSWKTMGVSANSNEASLKALVDGYKYQVVIETYCQLPD